MIKITIKKLEKLGACTTAREAFLAQSDTDLRVLCNKCIDGGWSSWARWIVSRLMTKKQRIQWAIYCAESVIKLYEQKHPSDKRPRKAIQAAKRFLKGKATKEECRNAAYAAATAAAAYDAASAASAAYAASATYAVSAAYAASATYAVSAAAYAASAASHAADAAARNDHLKQLIKKGCDILEEKR